MNNTAYTRVYSQDTLEFQKFALASLKNILTLECGLKCGRTHVQKGSFRYPLQIVFFRNSTELGFFDQSFWQIGVNLRLWPYRQEQVFLNLLRHEAVHMLLYIEEGSLVEAHGTAFRALCQRYGWGKEVFLAREAIAFDPIEPTGSSKIGQKMQKLLALSSSSNIHEAHSALQKVREWQMKGLEAKAEQTEFCCQELLSFSRQDAKHQAIFQILQSMSVLVYFCRGNEKSGLFAFGTPENLEIAQYVAHFLDHELDALWRAQKLKNTAGMKSGYFFGVALGYKAKIDEVHHGLSQKLQKTLITTSAALTEAGQTFLPHLRTIHGRGRSHNKNALERGKKDGRTLEIRKGVSRDESQIFFID